MIQALNKQNHPNLRLIKSKYRYLNLVELLQVAKEHKFGVAAINIRTKEILNSTLEAAWKEKSPIILEIAETEQKYCGMPPKRLADLAQKKCEELADKCGYMIPVCLHLDHLQKDLGVVDMVIEAGFTSLACDQSKNPIEKNIEITKSVVNKVHPLGVSVEGELGEMGAAEALKDSALQKNLINYVPTVEEAVKMVKESGIDCLAGFFGNGHGKYMAVPVITWGRIMEIRDGLKEAGLPIPLVMHGGSYLETHDYDKIEVFKQAIKCGCHKFNYATSVSDIFRAYLPKDLDKEMVEAAGDEKNWRKQLGVFEGKIDKIDSARLKNAQIDMEYHLRMMLKYSWESSGKAELFSGIMETR